MSGKGGLMMECVLDQCDFASIQGYSLLTQNIFNRLFFSLQQSTFVDITIGYKFFNFSYKPKVLKVV